VNVPLSAEMSRRIEQRLAAFVASDEWHEDMRNVAARLGALPLQSDVGGCLALHPDGRVLYVDGDQDMSGDVFTRPYALDADHRAGLLARARARYPELDDVLAAVLGA
jgi:hypothetical protein